MKELDLLLLGVVERRYDRESAAIQQAFRRLPSLPDPEILGLLTGRSRTDDEHLLYVVECLLDRGAP